MMDNESTTEVAAVLNIRRLAIIKVVVSELQQSLQFYKGVLGFKEAEEQMLSPGVTLEGGGTSLYLFELEEKSEPVHREFGTYPEVAICFVVNGVRAAYERCCEAGVVIAGDYNQPWERFATVRLADPDGNVIELWGNP